MPRLSRGTRYREGRREGRRQHGDSDTAAMKERAVGENGNCGQRLLEGAPDTKLVSASRAASAPDVSWPFRGGAMGARTRRWMCP